MIGFLLAVLCFARGELFISFYLFAGGWCLAMKMNVVEKSHYSSVSSNASLFVFFNSNLRYIKQFKSGSKD